MKRVRLLVDVEVAPIVPLSYIIQRVRTILHDNLQPRTKNPPRVLVATDKVLRAEQLELDYEDSDRADQRERA